MTATKSYSDKLKDPRWQKKRLEILERDEWKCCWCGRADRTLHVHHGYYGKGVEPWDAESSVLWTLCEVCHEIVTDEMQDMLRWAGMVDPSLISTATQAIMDVCTYEDYDPLEVALEYFSLHGISMEEMDDLLSRLALLPKPEDSPVGKNRAGR